MMPMWQVLGPGLGSSSTQDGLLRQSLLAPPSGFLIPQVWGENLFDPWVGKIPWSRKWQPTPVLLPVKSLERSMVGYSPLGRKESDTTE